MRAAISKVDLESHYRILCVDDEPHILAGLQAILGRLYDVKIASSGKEALEILRATPSIAVIISDMRMPSMNGAQFLAASRSLAPDARRILLTGHADAASAMLAVNEGGICRYLTKPCPPAALLDALATAIADYDLKLSERSAIRRVLRQELLDHDPLTGLASRAHLLELLDHCRSRTVDAWLPEVVFVIEVSDLRRIQAEHDTRQADNIIQVLSTRLKEVIPSAECVARYREATFAVLAIPADLSDATLKASAAEIVCALNQPIDLNGVPMPIGVTVGVARIPVDTDDPRCALRYAESAAQEAQRSGIDTVRLFSQNSIIESDRRRAIIQALRGAISEQQLSVLYQPIIDIENQRVYSLEALARWEHPQLGSISPGTFIPLAEETGLIVPLGEWVMRRACADGRRLHSTDFPSVSVNVSMPQLLDNRFMYGLYHAIETSGIDPEALELELTETVFAEDIDRVCKLLSEARLFGVRVAIDDFGSGYSSLSYLARLPVDVLKIDRTFVRDLDRGGEAIIGAALSVARTLKMEIVVEGIETASELERIRALGVTKVQGFFFARPMPAANLRDWQLNFTRTWCGNQ